MFGKESIIVGKCNYNPSICSVNHLTDLISNNSKTFEIHKLKQVEGKLQDSEFQKSEVVMKLEFPDEDEKENWMKTIRAEMDQLKSLASCLSHHFA